MTARGGDILAWLDNAIRERNDAASRLVGLGACPDWGHCQPDCAHENNDEHVSREVTDRLRRSAADRKLLELHGGRGHSCPAYDYDGDLDEHARFYDHEVCPVVQHLASGYGWTAGQTAPRDRDQMT